MDIGTAESVDRLLRIADEDQTLVAEERRLQHGPLRGVGILELIDEDRVITIADALCDGACGTTVRQHLLGEPRQHGIEGEHAAACHLGLEARTHRHREIGERRETVPERSGSIDEGIEGLDQRPEGFFLEGRLVAAFRQLGFERGLQRLCAQRLERTLGILVRQDRALGDPRADLIDLTR